MFHRLLRRRAVWRFFHPIKAMIEDVENRAIERHRALQDSLIEKAMKRDSYDAKINELDVNQTLTANTLEMLADSVRALHIDVNKQFRRPRDVSDTQLYQMWKSLTEAANALSPMADPDEDYA